PCCPRALNPDTPDTRRSLAVDNFQTRRGSSSIRRAWLEPGLQPDGGTRSSPECSDARFVAFVLLVVAASVHWEFKTRFHLIQMSKKRQKSALVEEFTIVASPWF